MKGKIWKKAMLLVVCLLVAQLVIGATAVAASPPASGPIYHYVRWGETLSSIGRLYGVNAYAIARANGLANPNYIYAGQVLLIPTYNYSGHYPSYPTHSYSGYYYPYNYSYPSYPSCYPRYYCW
jgi:LysM repeat protein